MFKQLKGLKLNITLGYIETHTSATIQHTFCYVKDHMFWLQTVDAKRFSLKAWP